MSIETIVRCERCGKPIDQANENPVTAQAWDETMQGEQLHFHRACWPEVRAFALAGRPQPVPVSA